MLDKVDVTLITQLQKSGRMTYVELAKLLGYNERTIRNRINKLLHDGMIRVTVVPNLDALGYGFIGIVGLQVKLANLKTITQELVTHPDICYMANVTGRYDFIIVVRTRSSREFADFMENIVSRVQGIERTETFVNLQIFKGEIIGSDVKFLMNHVNSLLPKK